MPSEDEASGSVWPFVSADPSSPLRAKRFFMPSEDEASGSVWPFVSAHSSSPLRAKRFFMRSEKANLYFTAENAEFAE